MTDKSEWHSPVATTRTRTSSSRGPSRSTSVSVNGWPGDSTRATVVFMCPNIWQS